MMSNARKPYETIYFFLNVIYERLVNSSQLLILRNNFIKNKKLLSIDYIVDHID